MKLAVNFSGAGVKDGQYSYLFVFVDLLDRIIESIAKLFALFNSKKEDEVVTEEATTAAPTEGE